jgi:hypothetical protein
MRELKESTPRRGAAHGEIRTVVERAMEQLPEDLRTAIVPARAGRALVRGDRGGDGLSGRYGALADIPGARGDRPEAQPLLD